MLTSIFQKTNHPFLSHILFCSVNNFGQRNIHRTRINHGKFTKYIKSLFPSTASKKIKDTDQKKRNEQKKMSSRIRKRGPPKFLKSLESPDHMPDYLFDVLPTKTSKKKPSLPEIDYEPYISQSEFESRLKKDELIVGVIRINPRNFRLSYINNPDGIGRDIIVERVEARNRAFPGDVVAVELLPKEEWRDDGTTQTGKVVFIVEEKHARIACGILRQFRNNRFGFALFSPVDRRLPRVMVPLSECPEGFTSDPKAFEKTLYVAQIKTWDQKMPFANGEIMRRLGESGLISTETEAILLNNDIDISEFSENVLKSLPNVNSWKISKKELKKRKDLREECIFTIDPSTARDLDDALSCKRLTDDIFEVGVHIADVSHFVHQNTELDKVARNRSTSVYLTQKVIPMLPGALCEELCSLNPGVERLAYSVIWKMRSDGTVLEEWFGRTVIKSCTKLSYDHAQKMIDTLDNNDLVTEDFPEIHKDAFSLSKISNTVKLLYGISKHLREKRFSSGALDFSENDISFHLDENTDMPNGCYLYEYKDSNKMIEEFMLLANMSVGHKIYKSHPTRAVLRYHLPPHEVLLEQVGNVCRRFEIPFDVSSSGSVNKSLQEISTQVEDKEERDALLPALNFLCMKSFRNAKYFCTGSIKDESLYRHYALNIPIYTHFTSPIRRYPDLLVHRLLTAALEPKYQVKAQTKELQMWAEHCTARKLNADAASEQSSQLFFAVYVMEHGPLEEKGVVVNVSENSIDILCSQIGNFISRVYFNDLSEIENVSHVVEEEKPVVTLNWKHDSSTVPQTLTMFSRVKIALSVNRNAPSKIIGQLLAPKSGDEKINTSFDSLKDQVF